MRAITEEEMRAAIAAVEQCGGVAHAAVYLGIQRSTVYRRLRAAKTAGILSPASHGTPGSGDHGAAIRQPRPRWDVRETDENLDVWSVGSEVRTVEDAIAKAEINLEHWEIVEKVVNSWPTAMKLASGDRRDGTYTESPHSQWNWQVKLKLRRRAPKRLTDALEMIHERAKLHSPAYRNLPKIKPPSDPHMLEVSLFDVHFGKLAWEQETGNNFDLKTVEKIYRNAVKDLLSRAAGYQIEEILFPVGQDFCNIDNLRNETHAGTSQDTDSRYAKIVETMMASLVWAIDYLVAYVPKVRVVLSWGNHDKTVSYHLCRELAAWYRTCKRVEVDYKFRQRKFIEYGINLIGLTHGNEEPLHKLPALMATEVPDAWARSKVREWHTGDKHKKKRIDWVSVDTHEGVVIRILPSLSAIDAWHYSKGYVGVRAAEAYLWSKRDGRVGNFSVNARE